MRLEIRKTAKEKSGSKVKEEGVVSKFKSEDERRITFCRNAGTYIQKCTVLLYLLTATGL